MKKCAEIVVGWVPDREQFNGYAARGRVIVYAPPETPETSQYSHTIVANTSGWVEAGVAGRRKWMQRIVTEMLFQDNIRADVLKTALSQVDEWKQFPFSTTAKSTDDP